MNTLQNFYNRSLQKLYQTYYQTQAGHVGGEYFSVY